MTLAEAMSALTRIQEQNERLTQNIIDCNARSRTLAEEVIGLKEQFEAAQKDIERVQRWFAGKPWEGHRDGSSFGCGDYSPNERAIGYGTYRDPRFLPSVLKGISNPATTPHVPESHFAPEGDERCGAVHELANATCLLPRGHEGSHRNTQGYWMPRPGEQSPAKERL